MICFALHFCSDAVKHVFSHVQHKRCKRTLLVFAYSTTTHKGEVGWEGFKEDYEECALAQDLKIPQEPGPEVTTKDIVLPKGLDSLENWGGVLITMDAWKKDKITFEEAISMAEQTDKMKKCLNFILAKFGKQACEEPPTQAVDLAMYLQARNYQPKKGYERTFVS